MQNLEAHIHQVEITLEAAQSVVDFGEALERLKRNPDFIKVIDEGYFTAEARRLTFLTAERNITEDVRENAHKSLRAIGELQMFFQLKTQLAVEMVTTIEEHKAELARAESGDLNDVEDKVTE